MTTAVPDGFVDPHDRAQVAEVLRTAVDRLGMTGLGELLASVPGLRVDPGQPQGMLRRGRPARVIGAEFAVVLGRPVVSEHVVGGIVLSRTPVRPADVPGLLAGIVCAAVAESGDPGQASVVMTSARDALGAAG